MVRSAFEDTQDFCRILFSFDKATTRDTKQTNRTLSVHLA